MNVLLYALLCFWHVCGKACKLLHKKIQDLDNYIIQLYILKYVGSMKQIFQLPDKNKEVVQRFGFFAFCCPVLVVVMQGCDCREKTQ